MTHTLTHEIDPGNERVHRVDAPGTVDAPGIKISGSTSKKTYVLQSTVKISKNQGFSMIFAYGPILMHRQTPRLPDGWDNLEITSAADKPQLLRKVIRGDAGALQHSDIEWQSFLVLPYTS